MYQLIFLLVICIAKNLIELILNSQYLDFFLHPQIPDFQILSKPYINGKCSFIQISYDV